MIPIISGLQRSLAVSTELSRLKAVAPNVPARFVKDGRAALHYLRGTDQFADSEQNPFPSVVFLRLKLPFVHGLDVLTAIRSDPALKTLRVYVLTSSSEEKDLGRAAELGIAGYLVKPPFARDAGTHS